ncbi:MAG: heme-degrading domain-containing protein [Paracoccaceae bacterium]
MNADEVLAEESALVLAAFTEAEALRIGQAILAEGLANGHPIVIDIRTPNRTLFHASLPGSAQNNDNWARRKSNVAFFFGTSSLVQRLSHEAKGRGLAHAGLSEADHALSGGAVPVRVRSAGIVAVATVSGLPDTEDHAMVVRALRALAGPG